MKKSIRKVLLLLCVVTCVFALTACGKEYDTVPDTLTSSAKNGVEQSLESLYTTYKDYDSETIKKSLKSAVESGDLTEGDKAFAEAWLSSRDELGAYQSVDSYEFYYDKEAATLEIVANAQYELRKATIGLTINVNENTISSPSILPFYSMSEKLAKAGLNTIIGMGTVFVVLIFISFLISLFKYISAWENKMKNKKEQNSIESTAVDNTIAQIVEKEEANETDDLELVAVITAAIAAMEGTSPDGLVVRSIKKVNKNKWNR